MQTLKSSKWLLKLLHITACFLIYHGVFLFTTETQRTQRFFSSWYRWLFFSL
jgi:hypothetical protein